MEVFEMRNLIFVIFFGLSLCGIANAQREKQASLPNGGAVDKQIRDVERQTREAEQKAREDRVDSTKAAMDAASNKLADKQIDAIRTGAEADRANGNGHGVGAAIAEKNAERAAGEASKAKAEAEKAVNDYKDAVNGRDKPW